MPAGTTVSASGDAYINGIFSGTKWSTTSLTYSFPSDGSFYGLSYAGGESISGFSAFNATQQDAVRKILAMYSAVSNLSFSEVTETATTHGDLRYAESSLPSTAWAYYPSNSQMGGDAWFNPTRYDSPTPGTYAWLTMMHETGHALGLKHPQENGAFTAMPLDRDSIEFTIMSYRSYVGAGLTGLTVEYGGYPTTLMMYDVAAIQSMYGADYGTNSSNSVYKWDPTTGQEYVNGAAQLATSNNRILMNVWDGGGHDTYDFSNYGTNLSVNLNPGGWTTVSTAQLSNLGGVWARGNISNSLLFQGNTASLIEDAIGGSGNDTIIGNVGDNKLTGNRGNDVIDGNAGTDTAVYSGRASDYTWSKNADGSWTVVDLRGTDGTDTLRNVEFMQFLDAVVATGTTGGVTPTPVNRAPIITSGLQAATLTEWADLSVSEVQNSVHVAGGSITYWDADTTDLHTATFTPKGAGYLGTFSLNTATINSASTAGWSFSVADAAMDFLAAGQTLTQTYDVAVSDGRGGVATQSVAITLVGTADPVAPLPPPPANSTPIITSGAQAATLTEWTDGSTSEAQNAAHTAGGSITYWDADTTDLHTATFTPKGAGYLGTFSLNTASLNSASTAGWSFSVADAAMDFLAAGQTLTQTYDVAISDGRGGVATQSVAITLVGTPDPVAPLPPPPANSTPIIASGAQAATLTEWTDGSTSEAQNAAHAAGGSITYWDADATDVHTATFTPKGAGYLGTFSLNTASLNSASTAGWSFSVADAAMDFLAAGQTLTQTYDVAISDGRGGVATQSVAITLVGTADAVVLQPPVVNNTPMIKWGPQAATLTEWTDGSTSEAQNAAHTAGGSIMYWDADATDLHTATFTPKGAGYLGTFSLNTANINSASTADWSFSVADAAMNFLAAGQTLVQTYDVAISDGRGGVATQSVAITLVGTADAVVLQPPVVNNTPMIKWGPQAATLTEWTDGSTSEAQNVAHTAGGSITYWDADTDLHTATFTPKGAGYVGTFSLNTASLNSASTAGWSFSVADAAMDFLAAGQTLVQTYDVAISDGRGGIATQSVAITLVGTADAVVLQPPVVNSTPMIKWGPQAATLTEWTDGSTSEVQNAAHTAGGSIMYWDADATDLHTATFTPKGAGYLGTFSLNTANINSAWTADWSFSVADAAMNFLAAGQTLVQTYDVAISDGRGGVATQSVAITLVGAVDGTKTTVQSIPNQSNEIADTSHALEHDQYPAPISDRLEFKLPAPQFVQEFNHLENHGADVAQLHNVMSTFTQVTESQLPDFFHFLHDDHMLLK